MPGLLIEIAIQRPQVRYTNHWPIVKRDVCICMHINKSCILIVSIDQPNSIAMDLSTRRFNTRNVPKKPLVEQTRNYVVENRMLFMQLRLCLSNTLKKSILLPETSLYALCSSNKRHAHTHMYVCIYACEIVPVFLIVCARGSIKWSQIIIFHLRVRHSAKLRMIKNEFVIIIGKSVKGRKVISWE